MKNEWGFINYLFLSLFFWGGIIFVYRYAINDGGINLIILLFITIIGVFYNAINIILAMKTFGGLVR